MTEGVTIYCTECEGPADVVEDVIEQQEYIDYLRTFWVRRLDCGHEDVVER